MSLQYRCATIGCPHHACRNHAHCTDCRHMRRRAKRAGTDPDARDWRFLSAKFGRAEVAA